jgi:hypothetical protein
MKFRTSIACAIRFRKNEHTSFEQKTENLTNDILNAPAHIFFAIIRSVLPIFVKTLVRLQM